MYRTYITLYVRDTFAVIEYANLGTFALICFKLYSCRFVLKSLTLNFLSVVSQWKWHQWRARHRSTRLGTLVPIQLLSLSDLYRNHQKDWCCEYCTSNVIHFKWNPFLAHDPRPLPHIVWWLDVLCRSGIVEVVMLCSTCSVSRSGYVKVYTSMPTSLQMGKPLARTFLGTGKVYI